MLCSWYIGVLKAAPFCHCRQKNTSRVLVGSRSDRPHRKLETQTTTAWEMGSVALRMKFDLCAVAVTSGQVDEAEHHPPMPSLPAARANICQIQMKVSQTTIMRFCGAGPIRVKGRAQMRAANTRIRRQKNMMTTMTRRTRRRRMRSKTTSWTSLGRRMRSSQG